MSVKKLVSFVLVLVVIIVSFSACGAKSDIAAAIEAHDSQRVRELCNKKSIDDISGEIMDCLVKARNDYNSGVISYDDAHLIIKTVDEADVIDRQEIADFYPKLEELKASKEAFSEAESNFDQSEWVESYDMYNKVIFDDSNYSTAQERAEEAKNNYLTDMFEKVDSYVSQGDLESAYKLLSDCDSWFADDDKYIEKKEEIESQYTEKVIADAKTAFGEKKNYEAAIRTLQTSGLTSAVITDEIKRYQKYTPVDLYNLKPVRQTNWITIGNENAAWWGNNKDVNEKSYIIDGIIYEWDRQGTTEDDSAVVYYLNAKYSRLTGTVYRPYSSLTCGSKWGSGGTVKIYGDGVLLYSSPSITQNTFDNYEIDIDVTGVRELKIVVFGTWSELDQGMWHSYPKVCLADVKLYK